MLADRPSTLLAIESHTQAYHQQQVHTLILLRLKARVNITQGQGRSCVPTTMEHTEEEDCSRTFCQREIVPEPSVPRAFLTSHKVGHQGASNKCCSTDIVLQLLF